MVCVCAAQWRDVRVCSSGDQCLSSLFLFPVHTASRLKHRPSLFTDPNRATFYWLNKYFLLAATYEDCHKEKAAASTWVLLEYNYSSNFLPLEYSLLSISGCKFPLPIAVFLQSVDELLEFMETWGFAISFSTCQPGKILIHRPTCLFKALDPSGPRYADPLNYNIICSSSMRWPTTGSSSLPACIKVLPVSTTLTTKEWAHWSPTGLGLEQAWSFLTFDFMRAFTFVFLCPN